MKSVRILVIASVCLSIGYGLSVTLHAWGQQALSTSAAAGHVADSAYVPGAGQQLTLGARRETDAEMDKLVQEELAAEREVATLIESYTHAEGDAQRAKLKSSLAKALEKEFDLQQKRRDVELSRVEARLKKVRELMQKRSEARQSIIDKRLDQLVREADGLGWTPPAGINLPRNSGVNRGLLAPSTEIQR